MSLARANGPLRHCLHLSAQSHFPLIPRAPQVLRTLSTSPIHLKKRRAVDPPDSRKHAPPADNHGSLDDAQKGPQPDPENPLDFSSLTSAWAPIDAHFKSQLSGLANGGRFNPDSLGALTVPVKTDDGELEDFPLRELAQVVPRGGRTISLLVNERAYIKPIMSAIQSSKDFNQQPQKSESNDLELLLKVEVERREDMVRRVKDAVQTWRERVRHSRTKHDKVLQKWKKDRTIVADVFKKAATELQKVQDKKMKELDQEEDRIVKQIGRS